MSFHPVVRPPALRPGDCIGLAAPASAFQEEELAAGVGVLQDLGFRVHYTPRLFEKYYYLAGSDAARAAELNALFADPAIKAIFCCRGGYGSQRLVPYLDTATIMAHPKIFVGYSDLTSLLLYLYSQCHLVTLHGPVVVGDLHPGLAPEMLRQLQGILTGDEVAMQPPAGDLDRLAVLRAGEQAVDELLIGVGAFVGEVLIDFRRRRRQADQIKRRAADQLAFRSEERRVGKECNGQCRSRWSPYH